MSENGIARIARAHWDNGVPDEPWVELPNWKQKGLISDMRAALAALPIEDMARAHYESGGAARYVTWEELPPDARTTAISQMAGAVAAIDPDQSPAGGAA